MLTGEVSKTKPISADPCSFKKADYTIHVDVKILRKKRANVQIWEACRFFASVQNRLADADSAP